MTYNGGLGSEATVEEQIAEMERPAHILAQQHAAKLDHDDVVQELLIKAWQNPDDSKGLKFHKMRYRAMDLQAAQRWTAHTGHTGKPKEPLAKDSLIELPETMPKGMTQELIEGIEWAYHQGEINEAIGSLTPEHRRYVVMRFWGGMNNVEVAEELGRNPESLNLSWKNTIRPALQVKLQKLAPEGIEVKQTREYGKNNKKQRLPKKYKQFKWTEEAEQTLRSMYHIHTQATIAEKLGVSVETVARRAKKLDL